jgi:hypothetical protein
MTDKPDCFGEYVVTAHCQECQVRRECDQIAMAKAPSHRDKTYLGDGLYAHHDGHQIILTAPRLEGDHWVALEPSVFQALVAYHKRIFKGG